ncbi:MAG: hypothetical protein WC792_02735 [Candidatus Micrarchaeia archaeon]
MNLPTASKRLLKCVGAEKGHHVIVVADHDNLIGLARSVEKAAKQMGATTRLFDARNAPREKALKQILAHGKEKTSKLPEGVNVVNLSSTVGFRFPVTEGLSKMGAYVAHVPTTRLDAVLALLSIDPGALEKTGNRLMEKLSKAEKFRIKSGENRVLEMKWNNRKRSFVKDVGIIRQTPARWGNIGGEVFTAPITTQGKITFHHIPRFGIMGTPVTVEIRGNKAVIAKSLPEELKDFLRKSPEASQVGEFGIGLMKHKVLGDTLHDEKASGTIHLAFGDSLPEDGTGGEIQSEHHLDLISENPTVEMFDGKKWATVIRKGKLLVK